MRRRIALLLLFVALAPTSPAQASAAPASSPPISLEPRVVIRLWEGAAPAALGTADHDVPVVAWWPATGTKPTAALVICPGGSYGTLAAHDKVLPLFVWHTFDDAVVKLEPILELSLRLKSLNRPHELHVYETGRHGLGLGVRPYDASKTPHPWTVECSRWLESHGF